MRVLIVGASIAGPALAYWLVRARGQASGGAQVTVLERAPAIRPGGYCVDIRGSALDVIERMGLRETLRPLEANTTSNAVVDASGRMFGRTARGFGVIDPDDIEILRGDLVRVLYEATKNDVEYRFGESVDSPAIQNGNYDVIVGADGVHSKTRALAFGPESEFLRPMGSSMAIWSMPNFLGLDREQLLFQGVARIASIKPTNDGKRLYIATFYQGGLERADVAQAFADAGWEFPHLIDEMWRAEDFYSDVTCQIRMPSFARGRVALVGDAAYCASPLSGQGTSLALVGAYVLAQALASEATVERAFARYDGSMRDFALKNQEIALKIGSSFSASSSFELKMRRFAMSVMPYLPGTQLIMKLAMRGVRDAANAIELPEAA